MTRAFNEAFLGKAERSLAKKGSSTTSSLGLASSSSEGSVGLPKTVAVYEG